MITFFRKIRRKLLDKSLFWKYILYAVGEIALVMIGILLALQVNSWKEMQDNKKLEKILMKNIHVEFENNLQKLERSIKQYRESDQSVRLLMSLMKMSSSELNKINTDSIIAKAIDVYDYSPTQNSLTEILASGNLKLLSRDTVKVMLLEWSAELNEKEEAWKTLDDFNQDMVLPYLTKNASMRNIDRYSLMAWTEKSKFDVNKVKIFNDIEFENSLDNLGWAILNYSSSLLRLEAILEKIIALTEEEK